MNNKKLLEKALHCNRCGTCRGTMQDAVPNPSFSTQCPPGMTLFGAHEPAGLMYIARGIALGTLKWDEDIANILYSCTLCGYCDDLCNRGYRHTPTMSILEALRQKIPGNLKPKALTEMADKATILTKSRLSLLKLYDIHDVSQGEKTETILYPDFSMLNNLPKLKEIGFILQKSGKRIGAFLAHPLPTVDQTLINAGAQDVLRKLVNEIDEYLEKNRIRKILCYNPESLSVLKRFSKSSSNFISILTLYAEMLKKFKHRSFKAISATYQDPCHLGRYTGEYISPRETIASLGIDIREMWRTRQNALCCGAGGGLLVHNKKLAAAYAAHRWEEAKATGAKILITACPNCYANMQRTKPRNMKVVDITSLVAQAFGYKGIMVIG